MDSDLVCQILLVTLPPGNVSREAAAIVSPGSGSRSHENTRSTFADPTTTSGFEEADMTIVRFDPLLPTVLTRHGSTAHCTQTIEERGDRIEGETNIAMTSIVYGMQSTGNSPQCRQCYGRVTLHMLGSWTANHKPSHCRPAYSNLLE